MKIEGCDFHPKWQQIAVFDALLQGFLRLSCPRRSQAPKGQAPFDKLRAGPGAPGRASPIPET